MSAYARNAYTGRESGRNAHGHDATRIHATRTLANGMREAACGAVIGQYGTADHGAFTVTCKRCKVAIAD